MGHRLMSINSMSKPNTPQGRHRRELHFDTKMKTIRAIQVQFLQEFLISNGGGQIVTVVASIYFAK